MDNKLRTTTKLLGVTALLAVTTNALAVESVTSTATVTVQNSFTFTESSAIDFGTIRAAASPTGDATNGSDTEAKPTEDVATLIVASANSATTTTSGTNAIIQELLPAAAGVYTVAGVAPYSNLTITLPALTAANPIKLTPGSLPPGAAYFWMYGFEATVTSGANNNTAYSVDGDLTADLNGDASFTVGATLATSFPTSTVNQGAYQDVAYTGDYIITVDY